MDNPIVATALIGAIAGLATAIVTWGIAKRTTSGNVETTDADRLWEQNGKLIDALTEDNAGLRNRLQARDVEVETMRERMVMLEMRQHQSELAESECNDRANKLAVEVSRLQERATELEKALKIANGGRSL